MKNESLPDAHVEMDAIINRELERFNIETQDGRTDLTELSNQDTLSFFDSLVDSGMLVIHGTNGDEQYVGLEPRQANDTSKESGNKKAVYATIDKFAALNHAIFNQEYAREKLASYTWGENNTTDETGQIKNTVKMTPELYNLFLEHSSEMMSNGYVYVLDKNNFVSAPDAPDAEFHSEEKQIPIVICKVSKRLGEVLFIAGQGDKDTVHEYGADELKEIEIGRETYK